VKHGNYSVSSSCGSSNVLEHFGYKFSNNQDKLKKEIDQANICYLHAPLFHPAMKFVAPVRKNLKIKTFFNILGPMINPCRPKNQIIGVFSKEVQDLYNETYKNLDVNYSIVYALDGYDEISLTGDFRILNRTKEEIYSPKSLNMSAVKPEELFGGDTVEQATKIFMDILQGKGSEAQNNVILANSAFAIKTIFPNMEMEECINSAKESLESKKALKALEKLIEIQ
jgi:anthranilate phosphoribosyltransferase